MRNVEATYQRVYDVEFILVQQSAESTSIVPVSKILIHPFCCCADRRIYGDRVTWLTPPTAGMKGEKGGGGSDEGGGRVGGWGDT